MSTIEDNAGVRLAERLKLEREARGWSLADLAERSGVSRGAISKIERGESSPTAGLLVRLADAFDLTLAGLIARAEGGSGRLSRAADQPVWSDPASGYLRRQVFERADHPVELVKIELPPGAHVGFPAASYRRIRQLVWVLEGALTVEEAGERHRLAAGDCLAFGPPADSALVNETDRPCVYLVALARS
jgi:transcriptional regulator with XRE-family HTH domain